ncbi:hypothetical protein NOCA2220024 [metagenome]|uniref:RNA polymerase, sigma-24 subunit, ECF subfamily n=1 Tax=metagenome TaxID=256318 RepID=A0A2P2BYK8_9ZZZZ
MSLTGTSEIGVVEPDDDLASDADLVALLRAGDPAGGEGLFRRHHPSALAFAISIAGRSLAPDLASEAFERVFAAIRGGGGPDHAFRAYLLTAVRRLHVDHIRKDSRSVLVDDLERLDEDWVDTESPDRLLDASIMRQTFQSLPERAQTVLWYGTVEGASHSEIGRILGLKPNAVAALAFRARESLRQAYVATYLGSTPKPACAASCDIIPKLLRDQATPAERALVESHLEVCEDCRGALADLGQLRRNLPAVVFSAALGIAAPRCLEAYRAELPGPGMPEASPAPSDVTSAGRSSHGVAAGLVATAVAAAVVLVAARLIDQAGTSPVSAPEATAPVSQPASADPVKPARQQPTKRPVDAKPAAVPTQPVVEAAPLVSDVAEPPEVSLIPLPSPVPTTPPAAESRVSKARLGRATSSPIADAGDPWFHVLVPVSGADTGTRLEVRVEGATRWLAHRDQQFGLWTCTSAEGAAPDRFTLACSLASRDRPSLDFALDLLVPDAATVSLRVTPGVQAHATAGLQVVSRPVRDSR